ncbi:hypothetical protein [Chryseobacterium ginsenosidimutans]|uniref:hypothetical protein n=1 Tax=Chryseobacterium ginsenosidimutans TaxID=687846 RepID=UPI0031E01694
MIKTGILRIKKNSGTLRDQKTQQKISSAVSKIIMNTTEKTDKKSKRFRLIKICIFLSGLSVFAQLYLFQPLLPMVAEHFHTTVGDSSLLVSSATIGMAFLLFWFKFFGKRDRIFTSRNFMEYFYFDSCRCYFNFFSVNYQK